MSNSRFTRAGRAGIALAIAFAFAAVPVAAQASQINLGTVGPFVVLGGSAVSNSGSSVLNGDLGVSPGTSLSGFDSAVVNGATHDNDGVARQAQRDLTTAYNVAAGQPVPLGNDLSTTDLGNRTLTAGTYSFSSTAQLTGELVLDAAGDPNAQFVFKIGSALTTAPGSSVRMTGGGSPCNVFWQVGSDATLDTTTVFKGNLMALTSITMNNGASVIGGRVLARNGLVSLINNVLDNSECDTGSGSSGGTTSPGDSGGGTSTTTSGGAASAGSGLPVGGTSIATPTRKGTATLRRPPRGATCTSGFRATVRGKLIERVVFSLDGRPFASRVRPSFTALVRAAPGMHSVKARVSFKDATHAKTLTFRYRACAAAVLRPRRGPVGFTG